MLTLLFKEMKIFSCLIIMFLVTSNALAINEVQKAMIQAKFLSGGVSCIKDHPLSLSDIRTLRNKMLPNGENVKCFVQCLFQKIGIVDDMGKLHVENAKQNAMKLFKNDEEHLSKVDEFMQKCSTVNNHNLNSDGEKGCDRAKLIFNCLVENAPKFGFDVNF